MQNEHAVGQSSSRSALKRYGKRLRACELCHVLKRRCELGSTDLPPPCQRCERLGKECHFAAPRTQKVADPRIAELEAQVAELTAQLHKQSLPETDPYKEKSDFASSTLEPPNNDVKTEAGFDLTRRLLSEQEEPYVVEYGSVHASIDRLVDSNLGERIFQHFLDRYVPLFPVVAFAQNMDAAKLRSTKPVLFLAILSCCSSGLIPTKLQAVLTKESTATIAKYVVMEGQKTLELVQALVISAMWFRAPEHHSKVNVGQLIRMAVTMAEDLGLDGRQRLLTTAKEKLELRPKCETQSIEAQRGWCGCFILSASTSLIMRRADTIHWSPYLDQCLLTLETHPSALPSDHILCQFVRAERLCGDAGEQLHLRDHSFRTSITDPVIVYAMKSLQERVQSWSILMPQMVDQPSLRFWMASSKLYIHEPALHVNHNIHEFEAPFTQASLTSYTIGTGGTLTSFHVQSLHTLVVSAQQVIEEFFSFPFPTLLILPPLLYASRVVYALTLLLKIHFCVTCSGSEVARFLPVEDVKFENYLDRLDALGVRFAKFDPAATQSRVLLCTVQFREWFEEHNRISQSQNTTQQNSNTKIVQRTSFDDRVNLPRLSEIQEQVNVTTGKESTNQPMGESNVWAYSNPLQEFDYGERHIDLNGLDMSLYEGLFDEVVLDESLATGNGSLQP